MAVNLHAKENERTVQLHEAELITPIQRVGIYVHRMVLVLPRICGCHFVPTAG